MIQTFDLSLPEAAILYLAITSGRTPALASEKLKEHFEIDLSDVDIRATVKRLSPRVIEAIVAWKVQVAKDAANAAGGVE